MQDILHSLGRKVSFEELTGQVRVLCLHGICDDDQAFINGRFMRKSQFSKLISTLHGKVNFINLEQYRIGDLHADKLNILLTFDDGYRNTKTHALPVLEQHEVPAVLFCTAKDFLWMDLMDIAIAENLSPNSLQEIRPELTGKSLQLIKIWGIKQTSDQTKELTEKLLDLTKESRVRYPNFFELLNDSELEELQRHPLIDLANHGGEHVSFVHCSKEEMLSDLDKGAERLNKLQSSYGNVVAYPFGHYSKETKKVLAYAGYTLQFIADGNPNGDSGCHDRLVVNPFISLHNQLLAIRDGKY